MIDRFTPIPHIFSAPAVEMIPDAIQPSDAVPFSQVQQLINNLDGKLSGLTQIVYNLDQKISTWNEIRPIAGLLTVHGTISADALVVSGTIDTAVTLSQLNVVANNAQSQLLSVSTITPTGGNLSITGSLSTSAKITTPTLRVSTSATVGYVLTAFNIAGDATWQPLPTPTGTGTVSSGTNNLLAKYTSSGTTVGNSSITDDGTTISSSVPLVLTNKATVSSLRINTVTPSSVGQVWTASDVNGNGSWQTNPASSGTITSGSNNAIPKYTSNGITVGPSSIIDTGTLISSSVPLTISAKISATSLQISTSTPPVVGQIWSAVDTVGNGAWATAGTLTSTNPVTIGKHTKWASATSLTDSLLSETGTTVTISGSLTISATNKITTPSLQVNTATPSVVGQLWTASDTVGNGSWATPAASGTVSSGTNNTLAKYTSTGTTIGNSSITDDGTTVSLSIPLSVGGKISSTSLQINTSTPSVIGQRWTATDTLGNGSWQTPANGTVASGTNNTLAKYTSTGTTVGNSSITDDGTTVTIASAVSLSGSVTINTLALTNPLVLGSGGTGGTTQASATTNLGVNFYDIGGDYAGVPPASSVISRFIANRAFKLKTTLSSTSQVKAATPPTTSATSAFNIQKNGTTIASFTIAITSGVPTWTNPVSDVTVSIGDIITVVSPATLNGVGDITFTLGGVLY